MIGPVVCISTGDAAPPNRRDFRSDLVRSSRCQPRTKISLIVRDVDKIATGDSEYKLLKMKFTNLYQ